MQKQLLLIFYQNHNIHRRIAKYLRAGLAGLASLGVLAMGSNSQAATLLDQISSHDNSVSESSSVGPGFGDETNLANGVTVIRAMDIDLPTNSALRIQLGRKFDYTSPERQFSSAEDYAYEGSTDPTQYHKKVFGNGWDIDVPMVHGVFDLRDGWISEVPNTGLVTNNRCSGGFKPRNAVAGIWPNYQSYVSSKIYWSGTKINVPGAGEETLLSLVAGRPQPNNGEVYTGTTRSAWMVSCLPTVQGAQGEGFKVKLPNGNTYYFDWMVVRRIPSISTEESVSVAYVNDNGRIGIVGGYNAPRTLVARGEFALYATKVEDRFGNWIKYDYDPNKPYRLLGIRANDGTAIALTYEYSQIKTITAGSRVWSYQYDRPSAPTFNDSANLRAVILPDQSRWQYTYQGAVFFTASEGKEMWRGCTLRTMGMASNVAPDPNRVATMIITRPSGATATLKFRNIVHGTNRTPGQCFASNANATAQIQDAIAASVVPSLYEKTITGPGLDSATWSLYYTPSWSWASACTTSACANSSETRVTAPDGVIRRYTFGNDYQNNAGQLLSEKIESAGIVRKQTTYTYLSSSVGQAFADSYGIDPQAANNPFTSKIRPMIASRMMQDGTYFDTAVDTCGSASTYCFDAFARSTRIFSGNSNGNNRRDATDYFDDLSRWVLGQVKREINVDTNMVSKQIDYDGQALPWKIYRFGKLESTLTYHADGTLATSADGRGNITLTSNWKRGIPQLMQFPATAEAPSGATRVSKVDDNGWITEVTNEIGAKTCFSFDAMGRTKSVLYPSETQLGVCDTSRWSSQYVEFRLLADSEAMPVGVPMSRWRQYSQEGNHVKVTYVDALWRPVLVHEYDASNVAGTLRATKFSYDTVGRQNFQSYPASDQIPNNLGKRSYYDALDRVIKVEQDSELTTPSVISTEYLDALRTRVTDARGNKVITGYMAWGEPSYDYPIASVQPEGKIISIERHPRFGWPLVMTQRSADYSVQQTRRYVYDGYGQLCKTIEPEVGVTVSGLDEAGNLGWSAAGLDPATFASSADCNYVEAYNSGRRVSRSYDARNRLISLSFPDGLGNQSWSYEKDGLPASITTYNGANNTLAVINSYAYNKRRLTTQDAITQFGWYGWSLSYQYDAIGNLASVGYPTGLSVDYAPNALGQATKAGSFASAAQYYPNGALKQFTYGNGVVHSVLQNTRQLPARVSDSGIADYAYTYDANANTTMIWDHARDNGNGFYGRWMTYDNLNRLTSVGSCAFTGDCWHRLSYDALDNIKSWKLGGVKDYADYVYDAQHRLSSIRNSLGANVLSLNYDLQGNLSAKDGQVYRFDYGNRLRSVDGKESYRYDALGRRVQSSKTDGSQTTVWQYSNAGQMLFYSDWDGAAQANQKTHEQIYLAGNLIASVDHSWPSNAIIATKYHHSDNLGSPVAVSNSVGQLIDRNDYEPYGAVINKPNFSGVGFTGHIMDGATGLTYMQQRYYDQNIGRFLSTDPVLADAKTGANFNRYSYGNNNPYKWVDPDGRYNCTRDGGTCSIEDAQRAERYVEGMRKAQKAMKPGVAADQVLNILNAIGTLFDNNGVTINFTALGGELGNQDGNTLNIDDKAIKSFASQIGQGSNGALFIGLTIMHEGSHMVDSQRPDVKGNAYPTSALERKLTEIRAYGIESAIANALKLTTGVNYPGMSLADRRTQIIEAAKQSYNSACKNGGWGCGGQW